LPGEDKFMSFRSLFDLTGKHVLATGAGGGIGTTVCRGFSDFGAEVACLDISEEIATRIANDLVKSGGKAIPVVCDVRDPEQVKQAVDYVIKKFGKIDVLMNLAGAGKPIAATDVTVEQWEGIFSVFLRSTFLFCQAVGRHMLERGKGSIINVSSVASVIALGYGTAGYSAAKAGVNGLTRELAIEWAKNGIRVNAIAPCQIDTPGLRDTLADPVYGGEKLLKSFLEIIPRGALGRPDELVGPCVFLASDASSIVTGHVLMVDAGVSIK
jgi:NAD(P)-dependent dehydrogenase (short-subunit alcohol dehydrogenase family)